VENDVCHLMEFNKEAVMSTVQEIKVTLGRWYEVVLADDRVMVGQIKGYIINANQNPVTHNIFLDGVREQGLMALETSHIRRVREVDELPLHVNVHS